MPALFMLTLFVSATLLFLVQPMVAKMILPLLGGSPAVWLTCMVFFQAVLLAGYLYAHALTTRLRLHRQGMVHFVLMWLPLPALSLMFLPLYLARNEAPRLTRNIQEWLGGPPTEANPIPWLLTLLALSAGVSFFVVSTTAPLLQRWFASTGHAAARDPYFLYAASNLGSMLGLLGYPLVIEPWLGLANQVWLWAVGYGVLLLGVYGCIFVVWRSADRRMDGREEEAGSVTASLPQAVTFWRRLHWIALSFVPSSLLFGVTTYLSTDIAAVPLLWVAPLALYLLTFIVVFSRFRDLPHKAAVFVLPVLLLAQLVLFLQTRAPTLGVLIGLNLLTFLAAALVCHGELARDRPPPVHLTEFYLWMSVGGVLGGLFNTLAAPLLFTTIAEYPLVLLAVCLLGPRPQPATAEPKPAKQRSKEKKMPQPRSDLELLGWVAPPTLGVLAAVLLVTLEADSTETGWGRVAQLLGLALLCYVPVCLFTARPLWFGLPVGVMLLAALTGANNQGNLLHGERGFYGVLRVTVDAKERFTQLFHGSTLHGRQWRSDDLERRREPLTYYHREGPIGQVFAEFSGARAKPRVALIGLGTGSLASYGQPGQELTFYEIDPAVERVARKHFTFLKESLAKESVVLGDGRLSLARAPDGHYEMLVVDAFSSDAIPVHLLTREVFEEVYCRKLTPDGVLAFHISNRYVDLAPVLANLARAAGLTARIGIDYTGDEKIGKSPSSWVVMARQEAHLGALASDARWKPLAARPGEAVWTDDYSNVVGVLRW